jgi:hypothetical protein
MDDILNSALTLFLPLKFIIMGHYKSKSQQHWLPFDVRFYLFLQLGDCIQHAIIPTTSPTTVVVIAV